MEKSLFCCMNMQVAQKLIQLLEEAVLATGLDSWIQCVIELYTAGHKQADNTVN